MARTKKMSDYEVLELAFEVISKEGFDSFTFEQVGKAVGLSPAAMVKRFKTKKRLALLARNQKWDKNLSQINSDKLHGLIGIFDFLKVIALSVNSKRLGEHVTWLGTEARHPSSKKKVAAYFEITRGIFFRLVSEALENGELKNIEDAKELAKTMEALVQGAIFQFSFLSEYNIEAHLKKHFQVLLRPYT
ncbi:TetR/AcrR family transcriptional regulator [Peredibacter sp. HCB2-198]|uniref:TetR/AcrR family transcriptional regulator n=1 Tax=Peredibacter sp. HCB2-198 TaxID=3383025 RepID=UPI0038B42959